MRRTVPCLLALLLAVPLLATPASAAPPPGVLDRMGKATRVIIVTTSSWRSTSGGATLWQKSGSTWRAVRAGIPVRLGRNRPTAGCVAMSQANLRWTLRWMTPGTWIVMGPKAYVDRL
jgi:hypothetical protein